MVDEEARDLHDGSSHVHRYAYSFRLEGKVEATG
jgi:hypothetical protein